MDLELLLGRFHPLLVHLPIGFLVLIVFTELYFSFVLKKELNRKSLNLTTYKNEKKTDNHICTKAKYNDYKKKINELISTLKESWKNEYKDNKM